MLHACTSTKKTDAGEWGGGAGGEEKKKSDPLNPMLKFSQVITSKST